MIISVSGIDCSGKSTQLDALEEALEERGHRVYRLWFRPGYSVELDFVRRFIRSVRPSALPTADESKARAQVFRRKGVREAWLIMAIVDTFTQYTIKLRGLDRLGWTVLCDRYIEDAILDLELKFPSWRALRSLTTARLRRLCPKPDHAFFLDLSYEEMLERMKVKNEPFPDTPEIRDTRHKAYEAFKENPNYCVIDVAGSIADVHQQIIQHIHPTD